MTLTSVLPRDEMIRSFQTANAQGRSAFIAFLTAGYPDAETTIATMLSLEKSGADIIELGVPFSDSAADGPTIQKANVIAIESGTNSLDRTLDILKKARIAGLKVPVVLMSSFNPIMAYSDDHQVTIKACRDAGAHGFIIADLPPEESCDFRATLTEYGLGYIPLLAPTSTESRIDEVIKSADAWIYAVSVLGVTGVRASSTTFDRALPNLIENIRKKTSLPIAVGFGVSTNEQFRQLSGSEISPDGIIVGSAIVNLLSQHNTVKDRCDAVENYVTQLVSGATKSKSVNNITIGATVTTATVSTSNDSTTSLPLSQYQSHFGSFGGMYVPETLTEALRTLNTEFTTIQNDPDFLAEFQSYYPYLNRPSNLHKAERLTSDCKGANIWLKREDLNHTGSHKITNALGQVLMARRLGKTRIIAETGAGQHGVATATICAKFGLELVVYMGAEDVRRQALNVHRMKFLGATVVSVTSGTCTLKDAVNEALRDWVANIRTTHYVVGSAIGPHPFPGIVKHFQQVISLESKQQLAEQTGGLLPDAIIACVGGGSNAIGSFSAYIDIPQVRLVGVEAAGSGIDTDKHSATITCGKPGVLHGTKTILLQDSHGQVTGTHSISAGLDYPGVGPEHAHLYTSKRADYAAVTDKEALEGFLALSRLEGITPALETSHAVYHAIQLAKTMPKDSNIILTVSGRGDKDVNTVTDELPKHFPDGIPDFCAGLNISLQRD